MDNLSCVYDTPFEVQEKTVEMNKHHVETERWAKKYHLYGSIKFAFGKELQIARQEGHHKVATIKTRYGPNINEAMRIVMDGNVYNIENIENVEMKNEVLMIRVFQEVT